MTATDVDVLVVGAGTTGLALALQAHDHGARVRVVEHRESCFRPSRALIVHPRSLEVLRPLGVTDALLARGDPAPSVRLHLGRREVPVTLGELPLADTAFPHLLIVAQAAVESVLSEALTARGVEVERGSDLVEFRPEAQAVLARIRRSDKDELVRCRYLAGCDGSGSTVRRHAGIGWRGRPYRQEVLLADVELDSDLVPGIAHAVAGPAGVLFLFALGERATWRLLSTRPAGDLGGRPGRSLSPVPAEDLQGLIAGAGLAARVAHVAWSARVPLERRIATSYRAGRVFLVGDAAHVHSPAGGQGMNTGIQDAANLGWKLAFAVSGAVNRRPAPDVLLDSYEAERRPAARRVVALTHLLFWGEASTDPVASFVRSTVVPAAAPVLPFLLRRRHVMATGVRYLSQLGVRYRTSPLSVDDQPPGLHGSRPGERLRDEPVTVEGRRRRLHELIARPGVHLLFEHHASQPTAEQLDRHVHRHLIEDWPGRGVVGVRPDGWVGYRSAVSDPERIGRWLTRVGAPGPSEERVGAT